MSEVDQPLAFPVHLLAAPGEGSYLSAELTPGSVAPLLFRDRGLAERFARANGIDRVRIVGIDSARAAAEAFTAAADCGVTGVAVDPAPDARFLTFPIREFAERLAKMRIRAMPVLFPF